MGRSPERWSKNKDELALISIVCWRLMSVSRNWIFAIREIILSKSSVSFEIDLHHVWVSSKAMSAWRFVWTFFRPENMREQPKLIQHAIFLTRRSDVVPFVGNFTMFRLENKDRNCSLCCASCHSSTYNTSSNTDNWNSTILSSCNHRNSYASLAHCYDLCFLYSGSQCLSFIRGSHGSQCCRSWTTQPQPQPEHSSTRNVERKESYNTILEFYHAEQGVILMFSDWARLIERSFRKRYRVEHAFLSACSRRTDQCHQRGAKFFFLLRLCAIRKYVLQSASTSFFRESVMSIHAVLCHRAILACLQ